ncbi:MAG TPA: hypothetical protein H9811_08665 [Candidatus Gemmiger excrementigallinarum]|uniref:Uncharacterized protein n=1 Tax=Candidatus Gemmiger excrementigallinarum TaxID=2838609 RepID=A0A9D2ES28_9FIRM|nr:hypothetical protein [Candidatus Gemmiger excrementigallinarum]
MQQTKQQTFARWGFYLLGMVLLALGLTLNTKTGLGASAIVSVPFTVSQATGWDFGNLTLVVYCLFVAAQFVIKGKNRRWTDLLQIPLIIGLCFGDPLLGVGLGTLISMVGVGRAIAGFNYLCKRPLLQATGM